VVEIAADLFRRIAVEHPEAIEKIASAAAIRRVGLEQTRAATAGTATVEATTLLARMKKFLRLRS
jgi:hypothetical protein